MKIAIRQKMSNDIKMLEDLNEYPKMNISLEQTNLKNSKTISFFSVNKIDSSKIINITPKITNKISPKKISTDKLTGVNKKMQTIEEREMENSRRNVILGLDNRKKIEKSKTDEKLSKKDLEILEAQFSKNKNPSKEKKEKLAHVLCLSYARVSNWFMNTRRTRKGFFFYN